MSDAHELCEVLRLAVERCRDATIAKGNRGIYGLQVSPLGFEIVGEKTIEGRPMRYTKTVGFAEAVQGGDTVLRLSTEAVVRVVEATVKLP